MPNKSESKMNRAKTPRVSTHQKKVRRQQIFLAVIGIVVILAMVLALVVNY